MCNLYNIIKRMIVCWIPNIAACLSSSRAEKHDCFYPPGTQLGCMKMTISINILLCNYTRKPTCGCLRNIFAKHEITASYWPIIQWRKTYEIFLIMSNRPRVLSHNSYWYTGSIFFVWVRHHLYTYNGAGCFLVIQLKSYLSQEFNKI